MSNGESMNAEESTADAPDNTAAPATGQPSTLEKVGAELLPRLTFGRNPKWTGIRVAAQILIAFVVFKYALMPVRVTGTSMFPGYEDGDLNFINRWAFVRSEPQRGDVVGVWIPDQNAIFLKRIIGLPGERLNLKHGWIMIDGEPLEENYLYDPRDWEQEFGLLPDGEYFVMGDNRSMDFGSHYKFKITRDQILGKVLFDRTVKSGGE